MSSCSEIIKKIVKNYLADLKQKDAKPEPEEIGSKLLDIIKKELSELNTYLPRGLKHTIPKTLNNSIICELIIELYDVKRIMWSDSEDNSNCDVGIYCNEGKNEGLYIFDESEIYNLIKRFDFCMSMKSIKEIEEMLFRQAPKCHKNNNRDLIAVNNGIFNYKTKELMPFSPKYVFTSKSRVDYNPNAKNIIIHNDTDNTYWDVESWITSLSDNPDIVKLLWQVIGAVIRPCVSWNHIIFFYSTFGNNGKGTLCKLLRNLCGKNNCAAIPLEKFSQDFMLEPLTRVSAVITDENSTKSFIKDTAPLKAAVTGDVLFINRKFKNPISVKFNGLIVQCINSLPRFSDKTESLYRRLILIAFDKCFTGIERKYIKDDYLERKEVLEYVLFRVLNSNYYDFDIPYECVNLLEEFKQNNDPVKDFLDEFLDVYVWDLLPYQFLYDHFVAWYRKTNASGVQIGRNTFISQVKNLLSNNDDWEVKPTAIPTGHKLDKVEFIIEEYNLTDWMNKNYTGNDRARRCEGAHKTSYKGIVRVKKQALQSAS